MRKTLLSLLGLLCFMIMQAQVAKTVTMTQAGTLASVLTEDEKNTITDLTLTGPIDARDFVTMRDYMPVLAVLDMEGANIEEYSGRFANEIPPSAFNIGQYTGKNLVLVSLPSSLTSIGEQAFKGCRGLKGKLNLPSGLTSIGEQAFSYCSGLTGELKLPSALTSIGEQAFKDCSGLTGELILPDGLAVINYETFQGCRGLIGELHLPAGIIRIDGYAFANCIGLTFIRSFAINPPKITSDYTFYNTGIESVFVPKGSRAAYLSADYWRLYAIIDEENAYSLHISSPGSLGQTLINAGGRLNNVTSLILTGELNSDDFTLIRENMPLLHTINMEGLSNISIPDNALSEKATLLNINLPSGLTSIGRSAFSCCRGLTGELNLPARITSIGDYAFQSCSGLTGELILPSGITSIGSAAFQGCSGLAGELILPSDLTSIGDGAFADCSGLTGELKLPAGITLIGSSAFQYCIGLTGELKLPAGVTSIGRSAFYSCSGLTGELNLPAGLTSIGDYAFYSCSGLTSIHIKKNVKSIGYEAFSYCPNVSKITCEAVIPPSLETDVFYNINTETCELNVPQGSKMNYLLALQWYNFVNIIEMDMPAESYLTSFLLTPGGTVQCNGSAVSNGSKIEINAGETMKLAFAPQAGYALDQVLFDGEDVTAQVQNNQWTSPAVSKAVTVSVSFKTVQYKVAVFTVGSGAIVAHIVEHNSTHTYQLAAAEGYLIENVTLNGTDVTPDLENGKLTLHDIAEDQTLVITSKRDGETSEIGVSSDKTIRTWKANGQLFVESTEEMMAAEVVDMSGRTACSISKTAYAYVLNLSSNGVYVVRIRTVNGEVKTVKVAM